MKEKSQKYYDSNKFQHKILINNKLWLKLCQVRCLIHLIRCKIIDKQIQIRSEYQIGSFNQKLFSHIKRSKIIRTYYRLY